MQDTFNELQRGGTINTDSVLAEVVAASKALEASIQKRIDLQKAETDAIKEREKATKKAIESVEKLAQQGQTPLEQANSTRLQELKDIETYRVAMQEKINDLRKKGDLDSVLAAKQLAADTQKTIDLARKESQDNYQLALKTAQAMVDVVSEAQKEAIEAAGLQASQFEKNLSDAQKFSAELSKAIDLRKMGKISTDQLRNFIRNSTDQISEFYREIQEKNSLVDRSLLKANDLSTQEGVAEFFRLASGQEDPAAESNRKQLRELQQIKKVLIDNGLKPVDIL